MKLLEEIKVVELEDNYFYFVNINTKKWVIKHGNLSSKEDEESIIRLLSKYQRESNSDYDKQNDGLREIIISLTDNCNLSCKYCARSYVRSLKRNMTEKSLISILRKAIEYSKMHKRKIYIQFHGGEPSLRMDTIGRALGQIPIDNINDHLILRIQTNGTMVDDSFIDIIKKYNIRVSFSLDGPKEINDIVRVRADNSGTFSSILSGIERVRRDAPNNKLTVIGVLSRANIGVADHLYTYLEELGFSQISLIPAFIEGNAIGGNIVPASSEFVKPSIEIYDTWVKSLEFGNHTRSSLDLLYLWNLVASNTGRSFTTTNCGAGTFSVFVETNGKVYPCSSFALHDYEMGDVNTKSFDEIMSGKVASLFLERTVEKVEGCNDCALQTLCNGGCPASALRSTGSLFKKDPYCDYWYPVIHHILSSIAKNPKIIELAPIEGVPILKNERS
jgi:uncharacterized protein